MKDHRSNPSSRPKIFRCPKCGMAVVLYVAAEVWCIPCGYQMRPVKPQSSRRRAGVGASIAH